MGGLAPAGDGSATSVVKRCAVGCFNIRRHEWPFALAMFLYFFLTVATFWILKPIKKGLFIQHYVVGAGGVAGGVIGSTVVTRWIDRGWHASRRITEAPVHRPPPRAPSRPRVQGHPAFEGARLALRSP